jgi:ATP-binding cassette subfamily F protein 3
MRGLPPNESDHHWKVEKVLAGLGFTDADMQRPPREFSGGYQVRLNLAKMLVFEPNLLLLDEPTNYLDITSVRWIIRFLNEWPNELMVITHDRSFMDAVVTHTLGIHLRKLKKIPGGTGQYYAQMAQEAEIHEKTRLNDERRRQQLERFITRFRAKARLAGLVQSRVKMLDKMEKTEKLEEEKTLDFAFRYKPNPGKYALRAEHLTFCWEEEKTPLFADLSVIVEPQDRVCVVGPNGRGKTTLLKVLSGDLQPNSGQVAYGPNVVTGSFEQTNEKRLVSNRTVEEEILYAGPDIDRQTARNICGAMMFSGDTALKRINVLSGGEKCRVMLGKLLAAPVNLLILDEPTNHLDMDSCDALLEALDHFDGAVVMVTHNEMFLRALANRLIVFQGGGAKLFEGTYEDFLQKGGWESEASSSKPAPSRAEAPKQVRKPQNTDQETEKRSKREIRRLRSEIVAARARALKPLEKRLAATETTILDLESELGDLNKAMQAATEAGDGERIMQISRDIHTRQQTIDEQFIEMETVSGLIDTRRAEFDAQLNALGEDA